MLAVIRYDRLLMESYLPVLIFFLVALLLSSVMLCLPLLLVRHRGDREKLSSYECGFPPFGDTRHRFDVRFYLVGILFIIFDLEIAFLFPWASSLKALGVAGFVSVLIFLLILTVGFIYEWGKGALEWE